MFRSRASLRECQTKNNVELFCERCRTITHIKCIVIPLGCKVWGFDEIASISQKIHRKTIRKEFVRLRIEIETNGNLIIVNIVSVHRSN